MIIEIKALPNGGHRNQSSHPRMVPGGWAILPAELDTPNFPFGEVETEEIEGVMVVTKWTAGVVPLTQETEATTEELLNIIMGVDAE